ncbi:hypothetical protein M3Y99_01321600 [Aphelenchoides fujianensis]|nr:hypothetical protein M3Y99_01321600 [Aphelenchoides fujianensis]
MLGSRSLIAALLFVALGLCLLTATAEAFPQRERRDGDFDSLLSEIKSKGSRMRFGKRVRSCELATRSGGLEYPNAYLADRYMWLL